MLKLYTTHCPKCNVLYKKLESSGIEFETCEDMEELVNKGFKTAPILEVDGRFMEFKQAVDWLKEVQAS